MDNSVRLAAAIDAAMSYRGMAPADLSERLGVPVNSVRRWRRGETVPGTLSLQALADALDAPGELLIRPPASRAEAMAMMLAWDRRAAATPAPQPAVLTQQQVEADEPSEIAEATASRGDCGHQSIARG